MNIPVERPHCSIITSVRACVCVCVQSTTAADCCFHKLCNALTGHTHTYTQTHTHTVALITQSLTHKHPAGSSIKPASVCVCVIGMEVSFSLHVSDDVSECSPAYPDRLS